MAITKRATKGSALTFAELDANFTHFEGLLPAFAGQINGANGTWTGSTGISGARNSAGTYTLTFSSAFSAATDYHVQATIQDAGNTQQDIEITRSTSNVILEVRTSAGDGDSSVTDGTVEDETISVIIYSNTTTTGGGAAITNLTSLSDVSVSSPQNGQILQYNTSSGFFENVTSSVSNAFTGLTDTPSSFGTTGQYLAVNSAGNALEFVSNTFAEINLADDQQAKIGLGDDLLIFHESSSNNSIIRETNSSGDLLIQANNLKLQKGDGQEDYLVATSNGSVAIKHDNATKLETTSSGIDVTGLVEFDSLSGTGSVAITDIYDQDDMASNSATALATQQSIKKYVDDQVIEGILVEGTTNEVNVSVNAGTFTVGLPDNVTVAGNLTVTGNIVPTNNETQDIGSASKRFKDIFLKGSTIDLGGTLITKDSSGNIELKDSGGTAKSISTATLVGTALDVNGNADISGNLTGVSAITASGAITGGSFVIGSADISEAELETIDGVTAGTVSASKAVVVDADKDITGFRNVTIAGNLTVNGTTTTINTETLTVEDPLIKLASGNASGDTIDIGLYGLYDNSGSQDVYSGIFRDATDDKWKLFKLLQAEPTTTVNVSGTGYAVDTLVANLEGNVTGALTGNADTATTLATARDIGGVSFNGSASINLPGVNTAGNQDTSGTAAKATVTDSTANTNFPVVFNNESDGLLDDTGTFIYNPSTGLVSATGFSGALTGTLQTAAQTNVTSVGTLNAGAISSGFGNIDVGSSTITSGQITSNATKFELTDTTDSASAGPAIELYRNGGNGSNNDELGIIRFYGNDSGGNKTEFATIYSEILDATNSVESGRLHFGVSDAGSTRDVMLLTASGVLQLNEVNPSAGSGPRIDLIRDNSNSSDEDEIGSIQFKANDDAGNITTYAEIYSEIADASNTAETGEIRFRTITAGASIDPMLTLSGAGSTLNSSLTVNNNSFEVVSTTDDANANPIVSLYRNRANPAASDLIGEIQFNGEDDASNKTLYAAISGRVSDETNPNEEDGQLFFHLAKQGVKSHITSIFNYGVVHQPGIHQYLTGTGKLQIAANNSSSQYAALYAVTPTANRTVLLPDADGTIVLKDSTDTLTNKSIVATQLTGTIDNARLPAAATNITSVGTLDKLEVASTADTATSGPVIGLYRNSASPATSDRLGSLRFFGENASSEKVFYAGIDGIIGSSVADGSHVGAIRFTVADGTSSGNAITDITADVTTDEDPTMQLNKYGLVMGVNNDIFLSQATDNITWDTGSHQQFIQGRSSESSGGNSTITLPDIASGTVITTGNLSGITSVGTLTALTVDNIAINGTTIGHTSDTDILTFANAEPRLTVNASAMEIVDTNAGDNPGPTLSLYRNSSSPANSDELGRILFLGQNDAGEKTYYAQIATEISSTGVDDGGEASAIRFYVTDGGSGTDNTVTDLTEDQFDIGPSDTGVLTLTSGGATIGGSVGLMLGSSAQGIRFEGSNLGEGNSSYENFLRQQEPTQASVNSGDNHSYQMLPRGSGVLLRSRGSSQIDDANVDKSADTVTFSSAHGLRTGDQVVYNDAYSTSLEISNVDADCQTFFAIVTSTTAIKLASTLANALAGTALDIDDDGADNQSFLFPHQMDNPIQMRDQVFEVGHKTTTERDALAAPTKNNGALIYNDTTESLNAYVGGNAWGDVEVGVLASNAIITGTSIAHGVFTTYRGKKVVFTGSGNCTVQLPNVQGGTSDIGATWTICNAGSANVILDLNGSGTTQTLKILTGASVPTATADPHIAPGGVASLICIQGSTVTVSNYILFGSGVVDNS